MQKNFYKSAGLLLIAGMMFLVSAIPASAASVMEIGQGDYILPESSMKSYTMEEISGMTAQQLSYARNEIFARYGRAFKSEELQDYFGTKQWYQPSISADEFDAGCLSELENENVDLLRKREHELAPDGFVLNQPGYRNTWSDPEVQQVSDGRIRLLTQMDVPVSLDLDGDGSQETIHAELLEGIDDYWHEYRLYAGDAAVEGHGENVIDNIYSVCLDGVHTLLVIFEAGPSDDPLCTFYRYENGTLQEAGKIDAWVDEIIVNEDGTMDCAVDCRVIQTDTIYTSWRQDESGRIQEIPQETYEFARTNGWSFDLLQPITVYSERSTSSTSCTIDPQSIRIPYTDAVEWAYIQASDGTAGWFRRGEDYYLESAEIFQGLLMAD